MRDVVVNRQLQHFRIDHDELALIGGQPVQQRHDHGVDGDRFARAGGSGDQQMRHAGEIDHHRAAADILAQHQRQCAGMLFVLLCRHQFAQRHQFAFRIRQLDADNVLARHHGDAHRHGAHGAGDVVGEADHAGRFCARCGFQLIQRDHRSWPDLDDPPADAEILKHGFEQAGVFG